MDNLYIIGSIAAKDIMDAIKNRFVIYQIVAVSIILLSIKGLSFIIAPPATQLIIYDAGSSEFSNQIAESPDFNIHQARTPQELQQLLSNFGFGLGPEMGIEIPPDFDQQLQSDDQLSVQGYVSWANRNKAPRIQSQMESELQALTGKFIQIDLNGNLITPPGDIGLLVSIITMFAVTVILTVGTILVPSLLIEEKQNRTLEALLVSPASIGQVVAGKAVAGAFYVLVTTLIVFLFYWTGIYSWWVAVLFMVGAVLFSTSLGLLFGVLFNNQQEMTGWLSLVMLFVVGSIFIELINLDLPAFLDQLLPWLPPVALARLFWASFSSEIDIPQVILSFSMVAIIAALIFGFIALRINRSDR